MDAEPAFLCRTARDDVTLAQFLITIAKPAASTATDVSDSFAPLASKEVLMSRRQEVSRERLVHIYIPSLHMFSASWRGVDRAAHAQLVQCAIAAREAERPSDCVAPRLSRRERRARLAHSALSFG